MYKTTAKFREQNRRSKLKQRYGISHEGYMILLEEQNGLCAICQLKDEGKYGSALCVDHNHDTGVVRGLLCHNCNTGLGKFLDSTEMLDKAKQYLKENN